MRKKARIAVSCSLHKLGFKLVMSFSFLLCLTALWRLNLDMEDDYDLMAPRFVRRSQKFTSHFEGLPKIAFLFLARRDLPLDYLWGSFFEGADKDRYSIYVHSRPGFVFDELTSRCSFFYGRQLNYSIRVGWGDSSMLDAERLLLDGALEDPANQRFVLISDSCIPLYNFNFVYNYLMMSPRSFVDSFLDKKDRRYSPKMSPTIPVEKWRKGSQWIALIRSHAEVVVDDEEVFPVFRKFCKKHRTRHNCIPDEHYIQTLLTMMGLEKELERRTLTYTLWNESLTRFETGWHPVKFSYTTATPKRIKEIKDMNHVYYDTEFRIEWCQTNSTYVPCFLFARKFSQGSGIRLLREGIFDLDEHSSLSDSLQLLNQNIPNPNIFSSSYNIES